MYVLAYVKCGLWEMYETNILVYILHICFGTKYILLLSAHDGKMLNLYKFHTSTFQF